MKHGSLFSGIGGFDLAAEWIGWENIFHCEINPFCQTVLKYYWPDAELFTDIKQSDFTKYENGIDILTGGFPCQPYSQAGKRKGKEDERHLWPEMLRAIREIQPRWIVGENVYGLVNWSRGLVFEEVQIDLENEGYEVTPYILPACSKDAPHRRDRIWFIAYRISNGQQRPDTTKEINHRRAQKGLEERYELNTLHEIGNVTNSNGIGHERRTNQSQEEQKPINQQSERHGRIYDWRDFPTQPAIRTRNDGIPFGLDTTSISYPKWCDETIKAAGNAVVPQVVYEIFKAIEQYENLNQ